MKPSFSLALPAPLKNEGFYANDPDDQGGETWRGIARKFNPSWKGWAIIDAAKQQPNFPESLKANTELQHLVEDYYRSQYWDPLRCDDLPDHLIALELLDTAINVEPVGGHGRAVEFLQDALNVCNSNGTLYADIPVDGWIGDKTIAACGACVSAGRLQLLVKIMNVLQGAFYIDRMKQSPIKEKYARGWFDRVSIST